MQHKFYCPLIEVKAVGEREFTGYGSVFGNVDLGGDIVMPGAFNKSLSQYKANGSLPIMAWSHDLSRIPGKWMEIREDQKGLFVRGQLATTPLGEEAYTLLKMEAVRGLSIGYETKERDHDADGNRLLKELDLWEISICSLPMNRAARVGDVKIKSVRDLEAALRGEMGFGRRAATRLASKTWATFAEELEAAPDDETETALVADILAAAKKLEQLI